ncbi:undecaprenyl-phosphate 4-deoxy-4-formamido-L-arabinose transferase [Blastococcus colisei]|uniref:Undecaprenyl-phosphate 4-deoxy-4-formamido-L-arabinose transferase n=1 Tax=Blastococcus colisei TaxID=1564162 RepID=A0A543PDQ0_9ACTN|nr:glycosyltransferase [Blastococcus colisei]TQN42218.1 undecaprenyl-phosphate 4-deoxy-4-formamido-L-arabinose transferase [Blastococcus colisei]
MTGERGPELGVAVVVPVHGNEATLRPLAERLAAALSGRDWRLRFVIDASPDDSAAVAGTLAAEEPRIAVTGLSVNVGQHAALAHGLAAEPDADAWVCLDADLQDPPEAVPLLLDRLARGDVAAVFAGRRGRYESPVRRLTGTVHRLVVARLTGLPPDAGAFFAMDARVRDAVVPAVRDEGAPSVVLAVARAGRPVTSVPVPRDRRTEGRSSWSGRSRVRQSVRSLVWAVRSGR